MKTVEEALAAIPGRRDALNNIDNVFVHVIRYVERVLGQDLKIGVPVEQKFVTSEDDACFVCYEKWDGKWTLVLSREDESTKDIRLVDAPRLVRADVFTPDADGVAPIEWLIIAAAETLVDIKAERSPRLAVAMRLAAVLEKAGFPDDGGQ